MCGIVGSWHLDMPKNYKNKFDSAIDSMYSRGPDFKDHFFETTSIGHVAFGHRRLSIIDLSAGGHQPMHSKDRRYSIIFNGMIYNFKELKLQLQAAGVKFLSNSDTEVLLYSWIVWKENCLSKIIGMFSFAIYDRYEKNFICARDQFGMKPFFYSIDRKNFIFASEAPVVWSLMKNKPELNLQRCYDYLVFGDQDNTNETFIKNVLQLPAGCILTFNFSKQNKITIKRWWYPLVEKNENISFKKAANILREKFLDNIKIHLRSDVPVGAALSGGVDSSAIVCAIRFLEADREINTFSYIAENSSFSEKKWSDLINHHTQAKNHQVLIDNKYLSNDLDNIIKIQGEPFLDTSILAEYWIFREAKRKGIKVMLEGQGGDELLAGYFGYPGARMHSLILEKKYVEAYKFSNNWKKYHNKTSSDVLTRIGQEILPNTLKKVALSLLGKNFKPAWINFDSISSKIIKYENPNHSRHIKIPGRNLVSKLRENIFSGGLPALLRYADRNSMFSSIECRLPFLTAGIPEFIFTLPEDFLVSKSGETKHIFRHAMKGIVPEEILNRKDKIGFKTPEEQWLKSIKSTIESWFEESFNVNFIKKDIFKEEIFLSLDGKKVFNNQIWRMINFYRWIQIMKLN